MNLIDIDINWLSSFFPSLLYMPEDEKIVGELSFCACYDKTTGKMKIELSGSDAGIRGADGFLCDVFEIEVRMGIEYIGRNGWPAVHEVGGRCESIADSQGVKLIDLHLYSDTKSCCLGIRHSREMNLTIRRFMCDIVIPFFYRLSYVDHFGIEAARENLWDEYSHGEEGYKEHKRDMDDIARRSNGRNKLCPCGSGIKYKKCCLDEVQATKAYHNKGIKRTAFKGGNS